MDWRADLIERLRIAGPCSYQQGSSPAAEPTALAGIALAESGKLDAAHDAAQWLAKLQAGDGSVGISQQNTQPGWPTGFAVLLWQRLREQKATHEFDEAIQDGTDWLLLASGKTAPQKSHVGHDTTLVGWSWAKGTHSWLEPTAQSVLALKEVGLGNHPRVREGVRLLVDRLLPDGGCNYGNTITLGQTLFPHVEPTGTVMWALGNEPIRDDRIERSLDYLAREVSGDLATASLCFGLVGLAAHGREPRQKSVWLKSAYKRELGRGASPYKLALILLAEVGLRPAERRAPEVAAVS